MTPTSCLSFLVLRLQVFAPKPGLNCLLPEVQNQSIATDNDHHIKRYFNYQKLICHMSLMSPLYCFGLIDHSVRKLLSDHEEAKACPPMLTPKLCCQSGNLLSAYCVQGCSQYTVGSCTPHTGDGSAPSYPYGAGVQEAERGKQWEGASQEDLGTETRTWEPSPHLVPESPSWKLAGSTFSVEETEAGAWMEGPSQVYLQGGTGT